MTKDIYFTYKNILFSGNRWSVVMKEEFDTEFDSFVKAGGGKYPGQQVLYFGGSILGRSCVCVLIKSFAIASLLLRMCSRSVA